jgi:small-conductance mechanosensitive channel
MEISINHGISEVFNAVTDLFINWEDIFWLVAAVLFGLGVHLILFRAIKTFARKTGTIIDDLLLRHCRKPTRIIIPLITLHFVIPLTTISQGTTIFIKQILGMLLIVSIYWLIINMSHAFENFIMQQLDIDKTDNLRARRMVTQLRIFKKMVILIVGILAMAAILMNFEKVRQLGTSLLASAGIAGIIVGLAAQRSIGTLIAGIQIAITQPIRYDDVVIVENEWGRIEEITLTYVVVRIWDLRRLILPITYFIEKPFQNWTRTTSDILGTVFIYTDYTISVKMIRDELERILKESTLWDGKVWNLQVTHATERGVELRALMSAPDASKAWNLRCEVRERLLGFIQENCSGNLPRFRAEIAGQMNPDWADRERNLI